MSFGIGEPRTGREPGARYEVTSVRLGHHIPDQAFRITDVTGVVRSKEPEGVAAVLPLRPSTGGSAGSFLLAADDGNRYWCKTLNNLQSQRVPITEQLVARLGGLIGAPVCEPKLVLLDGVEGYEFRSGHKVEPGWAHGSLAVDPALEVRDLADRTDDDNRRRHAGVFALHDWLAGSDAQWLYDTGADNAYYSHDHGFYLTGPDWTEITLARDQAADFSLGLDSTGLDGGELERLAERLEGLGKDRSRRRSPGFPRPGR
jgi:hypothetical protein